ncbi:conserved hypothetical protein [Xenorhabdus nematophila F1]|nr:hypothetical protein LH67_01600 [Xenorhabdus nematophila]CCW31383.1 conserved hypothetical protein [Xenorhabdus nematophila F1]CEF29177.1 conserved hypothetical protein [Xenorhabdus nematophila str. Websteri]CEF29655.1 conserved hypothetical protein [Xenorhabdus nematophila str. Websteri]
MIFYLYSQESLSVVLKLISMIEGVTQPKPASSTIYAISNTLQSPNYLWMPEILGFWSGNLTSDGPETFLTKIDKYD